MIFLTSDTHFGHDRDFIWKARGCGSVQEMNDEIVRRWNEAVSPEDEVWHLGDVVLGNEANIEYLAKLNGRIHIVCGNHDTDARILQYSELSNVVDVQMAARLKYRKYQFFLSHYPTITANFDDTHLRKCVCNLFGHTHQKEKFFSCNGVLVPAMYHVGMDSHDMRPVSIEEIIDDMRRQADESGKPHLSAERSES